MTQTQSKKQANKEQHWRQRYAEHAARGAKGIAAAWWDRARSVAKDQERMGNEEAWTDLARFLENFCARYSE